MKIRTSASLVAAFVIGFSSLYTLGASAQSHGGGMENQKSDKMGGKDKMGKMGKMDKMEKMGKKGGMGMMGGMGEGAKPHGGKMGGMASGGKPHGGGKYGGMSKAGGHGMDGGMGMGLFKKLDADSDGIVTREEAAKAKRKPVHMVKSLDTDKDGEVTGAEIDTWLAERRKKYMDRYDVNDDGVINAADETARIEQRFARFDADKDGKVTKEEFKAVMGEWRKKRREGLKQLRRDFWGRGAE